MRYYQYKAPFGIISFKVDSDNTLVELTFSDLRRNDEECELSSMVRKQLDEYFAGSRKEFSIPLKLTGGPFSLEVYKALQTIPYGEVRSYQAIAKQVGNEKACRAVGQANNRNPIAIIVPCHRVIGKSGKMVGFGGGISIKEFLLAHEEKYK